MNNINKESDGTAGKKKTLTYAYYTPTKPLDVLGLFRGYKFIEFDVPCDQKYDDTILKEHIAKLKKVFCPPNWKFVIIPKRYRHLDAAVIMKYVSSQKKELPPADWDIKPEDMEE